MEASEPENPAESLPFSLGDGVAVSVEVPCELQLLDPNTLERITRPAYGVALVLAGEGCVVRLAGSATEPFDGGHAAREKVHVLFLNGKGASHGIVSRIGWSRPVTGLEDHWDVSLHFEESPGHAYDVWLAELGVGGRRGRAPQRSRRLMVAFALAIGAVLAVPIGSWLANERTGRHEPVVRELRSLTQELQYRANVIEELTHYLDNRESDHALRGKDLAACEASVVDLEHEVGRLATEAQLLVEAVEEAAKAARMAQEEAEQSADSDAADETDLEDSEEEEPDEMGSNEEGSNEEGPNEEGPNEEGSNQEGSNEEGSNEVGSNEAPGTELVDRAEAAE
jgi:hypothetical protein